MKDRWSTVASVQSDNLDALVHQSRLIGDETKLVLRGGGNTSIKRDEVDFRGRGVRVLRIKGSGSDLRTIKRGDFPGVRLDDVLPLIERDDMADEDMVAYLGNCLMEPGSRRPSIETLLHAFVPAVSVAHTHADAILSLTNTVDHLALLSDLYDDQVILIPYRRPGFLLSKEVGMAVRENPTARGLILLNHGLVTWGESVEASYRAHIKLVTEAEDYVSSRSGGKQVFVAKPQFRLDPESRRMAAGRIAPIIRGALSRDERVIARYTDDPGVMDFVGNEAAKRASLQGAATPDHILSTKSWPLWVDVDDPTDVGGFPSALARSLESYEKRYRDYVGRWRQDEPMLPAMPRVVLVPGIGMWTMGNDPASEQMARSIYLHTIDIMASAESVSCYKSLSEEEVFRAEYWPLELYKLTLSPPERELARRVALVTGGSSGIGRAIAMRLASAGAHVVVTDIDLSGARSVAEAIIDSEGDGAAIACRLDVTNEREIEQAFETACLTYGGLDVLVSNAGIATCAPIDELNLSDWERNFAVNSTGHFLAVRAGIRLFKAQGIGGNIVFVATKNVVAPGKDFGAYSASKAAEAQLGRVVAMEGGEFGIRANMLNPDAVFGPSNLWSDELREERARSYGISSSELEDHYRRRSLLGVEVTAEDVAEAALFLASDRSSKTTGCMLPVDAGVREAFPR